MDAIPTRHVGVDLLREDQHLVSIQCASQTNAIVFGKTIITEPTLDCLPDKVGFRKSQM